MGPEASVQNPLERMLVDETAEPTNLRLALLESITNNFSDDMEIGTGGFAVVYKGLLQNGTVAVKKLRTFDVDDAKFQQEVDNMLRVKHKNIVRFLGYCSDTQGIVQKFGGRNVMAEERHRFLCFEFVPEGSLDKYISDAAQGLEWMTRYQIIKGICEGLHYLHQQKIVHLDLKPANILLDRMVPKIADFGLSKCFDEKQTRAMTLNVLGSLGYMAPESYGGLITFKSDIYSLGIIIIEILTGQKGFPHIENVLGSWSTRFEMSLGDRRLEPVRKCTELAIECTDFNPEKRPDTRHIIERLAEIERVYDFPKADLITSSATNPESTSSDYKVKLEIMGRVKSIPSTTGANEFPVLVRVTAPLRYTESSRAGLDLVAVLGINGRRLDSMKRAMMFVINNLGPNDRLSVVTSFGNDVQLLTELSIMIEMNRVVARHEVSRLRPEGYTNMGLALNKAYEILQRRGPEERSSRVGRVISLSDGDAGSVEFEKMGYRFPTETFGLGADHEHNALFYIAYKTRGTYSYVSQLNLEKIKDAFAQFLGGLMSITAMDVHVNLQAPDGVTISSIESGSHPMSISSDKRSGTIQVSDLYAGEQKNFIVYLNVPDGEQNQFMDVSGSYRSPKISEEVKIHPDHTELTVLRPTVVTSPSDMPICPDVAAELIRLRLVKYVEKCVNNVVNKRRRFVGLQRFWKTVKGSEDGRSAPQSAVLALDEDVAAVAHKGGKPFILSWLTCHMGQRATTKESPDRSPAFQVKAMGEMIERAKRRPKRLV